MRDTITQAIDLAAGECNAGRNAAVYVEPRRVRIETHIPSSASLRYRYVELTCSTDYVGDHVLCRIVSSGELVPPVRVEIGTDWDSAMRLVTLRAAVMRVPIVASVPWYA